MPEQTWDFIKFALFGLMGIFGWVGKRQINRIDNLEKNTSSTDSLNKSFDIVSKSIDGGFKSMKDDMNIMHTQTRLDIREIHKRIDGIIKK